MRNRKSLHRRSFLRGAGTVAIGLPFLEEMGRGSASAFGEPPARCITLAFGLGMSGGHQLEGFSGPLQPYAPFQDKMSFFTNVDMGQASFGLAHVDGAAVLFCGERQRAQSTSGGASIDQIMRRELHPAGPPTLIGTLAAGMWFREGFAPQPLRCWNPDGSVAALPIKRPTVLFERLFGAVPMPQPSPGLSPGFGVDARRNLSLRRSVLDTVIEEYKFLTGDASYLGQDSKEKIAIHLDRIREVELRLVPAEDDSGDDTGGMMSGTDDGGDTSGDSGIDPPPVDCDAPPVPSDPDLDGVSYELKGETDGAAPVMAYTKFVAAYRALADLYALALQCDLARFGNLMFESAGGHVSFTGSYQALGETLTFPGNYSEHGTFWHGEDYAKARLCSHMFQTQLAYFLTLLDDPGMLEENGKTLLDNTLVVIGTEVGWNHDLSPVFHAIAGGNGNFRPGFYNDRINCVDIYNTALRPYGVDAQIGVASGYSNGDVPGLLV